MQPERNSPLSARSVIASTLLGVHPPALSSRVLVRSGELFGIAEGTTRVALSRMVATGELEADDGSYRLAGHLLERQARQDASRKPPRWGWNGQWRMAVVVADRRSPEDRNGLRQRLQRARYAELREGVWTRPDNLPGDRPEAAGCEWIKATFDDPAETAASLWDLSGWATLATDLEASLENWTPRLHHDGVTVLAPAFVVSADVLRHLQADPLLPRELLAKDWPGPSLRSTYEQFDTAFKKVWRDWYRSTR